MMALKACLRPMPRRRNYTALVATPALAGGYSGGTNWGAVAGAGILGGILGSALAPQQPQVIIVQPAPIYAAPPGQPVGWWCDTSNRWYPGVFACAVPWR
jgi:hypothetical protein